MRGRSDGAEARRRTVLATNRAARHHYHLLERFEAGIELIGTEVKAIRAGRINLKEGFVVVEAGEAYLVGCHVGHYSSAGYASHDPLRRRRLLLHRREVDRLGARIAEKGLTAVPLAVVLDGRWIKLELALVRGKQLQDKRETLRRRVLDREAEQAIKERGRG